MGLINRSLQAFVLLTALTVLPVAKGQSIQRPEQSPEQSPEQPSGDVLPESTMPTFHAGSETDRLDEKQREAASELRIAMRQAEIQSSTAIETTDQPNADASRVDLLKQIDVVIAQQQSAKSSTEDHDAQLARLRTTLTRLEEGSLEQGPPFSLVFLDSVKESLRNSQTKLASAESSLVSSRENAEQAKASSEARAVKLRQIREGTGEEQDAETQLATLEQKLAEEILVLRRQEMSIEESSVAIAKLQVRVDQRKIEIVGDRVTFTPQDLNERLADLDSLETRLRDQVTQLLNDLQLAERRWLAARQEADSMLDAPSALTQRVDSLKVSQMTVQLELSLINQRLQRIPGLRKAWERRYLVIAGGTARKDRYAWSDETRQQIEQVAQDRRSRQLKIDELRVSQSTVDAKIDAAADDVQSVRWLKLKRTALDKQSELLQKSLLVLDNAQRSLERLQTQINGQPSRSLPEIFQDSWSHAERVWNYELAAIDETSLTVGKVCSSVLMLFFGFLLARWLSAWLGGRLPKWGVEEAAADAIESLTFYALLITLGLTALRYANVPLTVFTFLGGAIAIGIGFGSQNILNNFISGLILLAERPIKVGDLIMIGNTYGNVTKIGARSTQIRTGENQDIIVPNSKFLENEVTNLTRRDDRLRTSITIGVAYGSDLDTVMRLLARSASEQSGVLERPKPMVWFNDFGDNALVFQVHFWVQAKNVSQMRMIETGVRLKIDSMFREAGVSIAFPQRDLHLHSSRPIDFRLVTGDQATTDSLGKVA